MQLSKKIMEDFEHYCKKNNITGKAKEEKFEKLKAAAEKYLYEPGEAISIIAAQSISEPATQMSVDAAERIVLKNRDTIAIHDIGTFVDSMLQRNSVVEDNGWEAADLSALDIKVPSI